MTDAKCGTWAEHFPGNLLWSNAMQIVKGMAPYGAVAMAEVDHIGQRLKARENEVDPTIPWHEEWFKEAARLSAIADKAAAEGRDITAGHNYHRAANYYYSSERMMEPGEAKLAVYRQALRCWTEAFKRLYPEIERVEVPYEDTSLPAYFVRAKKSDGPAPTVILFDGMDNAKEMSVVFAALDFAKRGINTLAIDGPGQSEALRLRNITSRPDYEVAGGAAYDYVTSRPEVDPKRVAVMGYSFGGYHGPRIAGKDPRIAACVVFGAMHWDMHAWQADIKARLAADITSTFSTTFQFRWVVGSPDNAAALERAKLFTLEGIAENITCPVLILHGDNDRVVPLESAKILYEKIGSKDKELRIFTAEEGGTEHVQVDHRQLGVDHIADWLVARLKPKG